MLLTSSFQVNMDLSYRKMVVLVNVWLLADAAPLAMLQHATSSQSIVFHQPHASTSQPVVSNSSPLEHFGSTDRPKYEYKYEVSDHQTGDRKSHWESRDGDRVRGVYTLYEPDGALRTVEYTADSIHGFNAVVRRDEATPHIRRPQESYNRSSNANDGYDAFTTSSRYSETKLEPNRFDDRSGSPYNPGVEFSVSHNEMPLKRQDKFLA